MMQIKKIQAPSVSEALLRIREEFGPDAVILHTRQLESSSGKGTRPGVEVTAGVDKHTQKNSGFQPAPVTEPRDSSPEDIRDEMNRMRQMIERLTREMQFPDIQHLPVAFREWYMRLSEQDVDLAISRDLIQSAQKKLGNEATVPEVGLIVEELVEELFPVTSTNRSRKKQQIIAIVGPTGVGKTTTIAKLAAEKTIEEGRSVALITADTYRVAATDQLQVFADLIQVPLEIVYTPAHMKKAIQSFSEYDYIFIDTTGRSQNDEEHIQQVKTLLQPAHPGEIHLVLSATTAARTLTAIAANFSVIPVTDLIVSKIDEAESLGGLLGVFKGYDWPVSYFTNGQSVPEDIFLGSAPAFCNRLFGAIE